MRKTPQPTRADAPKRGFRGVPPPADFSLAALPDDALLTEYDVASILRVSTSTVEKWRKQPDHPLKCERLPGRLVRYRADALRNFIALGRRRRKPSAASAPAKPTPEAAAPPPSPSAKRSVALARAVTLFGSQQKLAQAAGVSKNTIFDALHGYRSVSHTVATKIEQATGGRVTAEELLLEGLPPKPSPPPSKLSSERPAPKTKCRAVERADLGEAAK